MSVFISDESESEVAQLCPTLCDPVDCSLPAPPPMGFSRQEYWSGLPYRPVIFFLCVIFVFGIRVMVALYNEFGCIPSSAIFCQSLRWIGVSFSLKV